jgi:hypothetical protein
LSHFNGLVKSDCLVCHAGGREFESRRSRHNKIKGLEEIQNPLLFPIFSNTQHYTQQTGKELGKNGLSDMSDVSQVLVVHDISTFWLTTAGIIRVKTPTVSP